MKAEIYGIYNGVTESSFNDENGNVIPYKTVTLLEFDSNMTLSCSVNKDVDLSILKRFDSACFMCNLVNGKRPKIVGVNVDSINKAGK